MEAAAGFDFPAAASAFNHHSTIVFHCLQNTLSELSEYFI